MIRRTGRRKWTNETVQNLLDERGHTFKCIEDLTLVHQPSVTKVSWQCNSCQHIWTTTVDSIQHSNSGCPICSGNFAYTKESLQSRIDRSRNPILVLDLFTGTASSGRRALFECSEHHTWESSIHNVVKFGYGCPICNSNISTPSIANDGAKVHSKLEKYAYDALLVSGIKFEAQKRYTTARRFKCDFYIPKLRLWLEVSGPRLLTWPKYQKALAEKQQIVESESLGTFKMVKSFAEIDQQIKDML